MGDIDPARVRALPKVELHVHLEGSIAPETARLLARRHGVDPADLGLVDGRYPRSFSDLAQFVDLYLAVSALIRTPDDLETVAAAFAAQQVAQNVRYSEATFTAMTHVRNGLAPAAMWTALRRGLAQGGASCEIRLIVDVRRDLGPDNLADTIAVVEAADAPIVALGLTGIETSPPHERDFLVLRETADRLGMGLVVHSGEETTAENVRATLDDLRPDRIAHGVGALQDKDLMARLTRDQVPLDMCISSNVATGQFRTLDVHPFPAFWRAGVNVNVNSDDPPFFSTTLTDELLIAARVADLTERDLAELQRRAAMASFAAAGLKTDVVDQIEDWGAFAPA